MHRSILLVGLVVALGSESPGKVLMAPLEVTGELSAERVAEFEQRVLDGCRRKGQWTAARFEGQRCTDAACWALAAEAQGAELIVVPKLEVEERDYRLVLQVVSREGETIAERATTCDVCGAAEVGDRMEDETATLLTRVDVARGSAPRIAVRSSPTGAEVLIDGAVVGTTPYDAELSEGEHAIELRKKGYAGRTAKAVTTKGTTIDVDLDLVPLGDPRKPIHPAIGGTLLAGGVVSAAIGATLWAIDEQPRRSTCGGEDVDVDGDCRHRFATKEAGISMVVVGSAIVITGAALLGVSLARREPSRKNAHLSPRADGFALKF